MNKLTADKCRAFISTMKAQQQHGVLGIAGQYHLQAMEIALPVLEKEGEWRNVPLELTDEMIRGIVPNMAHSKPINHDEYDYTGRNEHFVKWIWSNLLALAPQPQPSTNPHIDNDGWIEWGSGDNPPAGKFIQVKFRDGMVDEERPSELYRWYHAGSAGDIIAYRVIERGREG